MDPISFNKMLDEYYQLHGWDENGRPTEEGVKRLEIPL
jgi:aldehyde:ferredoxin oxidoreductase